MKNKIKKKTEKKKLKQLLLGAFQIVAWPG